MDNLRKSDKSCSRYHYEEESFDTIFNYVEPNIDRFNIFVIQSIDHELNTNLNNLEDFIDKISSQMKDKIIILEFTNIDLINVPQEYFFKIDTVSDLMIVDYCRIKDNKYPITNSKQTNKMTTKNLVNHLLKEKYLNLKIILPDGSTCPNCFGVVGSRLRIDICYCS